jgi:hypothetical protein
MNTKLQNIGASLLWFLGAAVFIAQGYRAVAYYLFDVHIDWTWHDVMVGMISFAVMFIPAKLKSIVSDTLTRIAGKK